MKYFCLSLVCLNLLACANKQLPPTPLQAMTIEPAHLPAGLPKLATVELKQNHQTIQQLNSHHGFTITVMDNQLHHKIVGSIILGQGTTQAPINSQLIAELLGKSIQGLSLAELAHAKKSIGLELTVSVGTHFTTVDFSVMPNKLEQAFALIHQALQQLDFSQKELDKAKRDMLLVNKAKQYASHWLANQLIQTLIMGDNHPWLAQWINIDAIQAVKADTLKQYYQDNYLNKPLVITLLNHKSKTEVLAVIEKHWHAWPGNQQIFKPIISQQDFHTKPVQSHQLHVIDIADSQQVEIRAGLKTISIFDADWPAIYVLAEILGGNSGRLFKDLRENQGLTYGIYARQSKDFNIAGSLIIQSSSQAHKLPALMHGIQQHWQAMPEQLSQTEVTQAKNKILGSFVLSQNNINLSRQELNRTLKLQGYSIQHLYQLQQKIKQVTLADVKKVAQQYHQQPLHWVMAGDADDIQFYMNKLLPQYQFIFYDRKLKLN